MRLLWFFVRGRPWRSLATLGLLAVAGIAEGMGLATLLPLVRLAIDDGSSQEPSNLERQAQEWMTFVGIPETLFGVSAVFLTLLTLKAGFILAARRQVGYESARVVTEMRMKLLRGLLSARWGYFTEQPIGALANSLGTEANRTAQAYRNLFLAIQLSLMTAAYVVVASALSWELMLGAIGCGVLMWGVMHGWVRFARTAGGHQTRVTRSLLSRVTDGLQSMRLLKATAREDAIGPILAADTKDLKRSIKKQIIAKASLSALNEPIIGLFLVTLIFVGKEWFGFFLGELLVLLYAFERGFSSLNKVQRRVQITAVDSSAVWAMNDEIEKAEQNAEVHHGTAEPNLTRAIELHDVRVEYEGRPVLAGISLEIPAGRITAILGESGAGKTTLVDTLTGLASPLSGTVSIDDVPLADIDLAKWRGRIGFVPQEVLMLNDSVRANITLGDDVSDAEIERALKAARAWEFVRELPEGLETSVGERGARFSGGQRSRLALARALLRRPSLLILDEATASLDVPSEQAIWEALQQLRGEATIVAISHQPHLATVADRIYRLEGGRVTSAEVAEKQPGDVAELGSLAR